MDKFILCHVSYLFLPMSDAYNTSYLFVAIQANLKQERTSALSVTCRPKFLPTL